MTLAPPARAASAAVALIAWSGILLLVADQAARFGGDWAAALWWNARYFTDLSNLLIAIVTTLLALRPRLVGPRLFGTPLASTLMASIVYYGLLGGLSALGANGTGDVIAHAVVPPALLLLWLLLLPRRQFRWSFIPVWALFPLAYCAYAIVRGLVEGRYPYFFLDVSKLGGAVAVYVTAILLLFCTLAALLVLADRHLPGRASPLNPPRTPTATPRARAR